MVLFSFITIIFACLGSFGTVLISRYPYTSSSIISGRSQCPQCKTLLPAVSLIPVLSFIIQKRRCKNCKKIIPWHYFIIEIGSIVIGISLYIQLGFNLTFYIHALLFLTLWVLFWIDLKQFTLPNRYVLIIAILGLIHSSIESNTTQHLLALLLCIIIIGSINLIGRWFYKKDVLGGGDIKLMGALALYLGIYKSLLLLYLSFMIGGLVAITLIALKTHKKTDYIPFGPSIIFTFVLIYSAYGQICQFLFK